MSFFKIETHLLLNSLSRMAWLDSKHSLSTELDGCGKSLSMVEKFRWIKSIARSHFGQTLLQCNITYCKLRYGYFPLSIMLIFTKVYQPGIITSAQHIHQQVTLQVHNTYTIAILAK